MAGVGVIKYLLVMDKPFGDGLEILLLNCTFEKEKSAKRDVNRLIKKLT